jgi:hypothetical protein
VVTKRQAKCQVIVIKTISLEILNPDHVDIIDWLLMNLLKMNLCFFKLSASLLIRNLAQAGTDHFEDLEMTKNLDFNQSEALHMTKNLVLADTSHLNELIKNLLKKMMNSQEDISCQSGGIYQTMRQSGEICLTMSQVQVALKPIGVHCKLSSQGLSGIISQKMHQMTQNRVQVIILTSHYMTIIPVLAF